MRTENCQHCRNVSLREGSQIWTLWSSVLSLLDLPDQSPSSQSPTFSSFSFPLTPFFLPFLLPLFVAVYSLRSQHYYLARSISFVLQDNLYYNRGRGYTYGIILLLSYDFPVFPQILFMKAFFLLEVRTITPYYAFF